jgi:hypothetical protein
MKPPFDLIMNSQEDENESTVKEEQIEMTIDNGTNV